MSKKHSTFKERVLPFTAAAVALGAIVTFSGLSANLTSGASAQPTPERSLTAAAASGKTVVTNKNPGATKQYWTQARLRGAKDILTTRTDAHGESYGNANLDFTRSRISPQNANKQKPYTHDRQDLLHPAGRRGLPVLGQRHRQADRDHRGSLRQQRPRFLHQLGLHPGV